MSRKYVARLGTAGGVKAIYKMGHVMGYELPSNGVRILRWQYLWMKRHGLIVQGGLFRFFLIDGFLVRVDGSRPSWWQRLLCKFD